MRDDDHPAPADAPAGDAPGDAEVARAKRALRREVQRAVEEMPADRRATEGRAAVERLYDLDAFQRAKELMVYVSVEHEVPTRDLIEERLDAGVTVSVPRVAGGGLDVVPIESLKGLEPGPMGIPEPPGRPEDPRLVDLAVVPGLAFDREGRRLGRGTGHFDRFLNEHDPPAAGLCFSRQLVEAVPVQEWDHPVDLVVTPDGVYGPLAGQAVEAAGGGG